MPGEDGWIPNWQSCMEICLSEGRRSEYADESLYRILLFCVFQNCMVSLFFGHSNVWILKQYDSGMKIHRHIKRSISAGVLVNPFPYLGPGRSSKQAAFGHGLVHFLESGHGNGEAQNVGFKPRTYGRIKESQKGPFSIITIFQYGLSDYGAAARTKHGRYRVGTIVVKIGPGG